MSTPPELCSLASGKSSEDVSWLLSMGIVVISMQGGFALLEAGGVRSNNGVNIMMKNVCDMCAGGLVWWMVGWGLAYGTSWKTFMGSDQFFGQGVNDPASWFFQFSFAATAATIDSGAVAERMNFRVYVLLSTFMTAWMYPVVAHWAWGGGFLAEWGFIDFAGSGVVHMLGGFSGLMSAWLLGPRLGRYTNSKHVDARSRMQLNRDAEELEPQHHESFQANNPTNQLFGTLLLWIGWYGFNCGSVLTLADGRASLAGQVAITTTVAASGGGVVASCMSYWQGGKVTVSYLSNGILAALVGITASANVVSAWEALIIGVISSICCTYSVQFIDYLHIDDPVSAISIHGVAGFVGVCLAGIFAGPGGLCSEEPVRQGLLWGGGWHQLGVQALSGLIIMGWAFANTLFFFVVIAKLGRLRPRVGVEHELLGLDLTEHGVDQGEQLLQIMRNLYVTVLSLSPRERVMVRRIFKAFLDPSIKSDDHFADDEFEEAADDKKGPDTGKQLTGKSRPGTGSGKKRRVRKSRRRAGGRPAGPVEFVRMQALRDSLLVANPGAEEDADRRLSVPVMHQHLVAMVRRTAGIHSDDSSDDNEDTVSGGGGDGWASTRRTSPASASPSVLVSRPISKQAMEQQGASALIRARSQMSQERVLGNNNNNNNNNTNNNTNHNNNWNQSDSSGAANKYRAASPRGIQSNDHAAVCDDDMQVTSMDSLLSAPMSSSPYRSAARSLPGAVEMQ